MMSLSQKETVLLAPVPELLRKKRKMKSYINLCVIAGYSEVYRPAFGHHLS